MLNDAGFQSVRRYTSTADRGAPFDPPTTAFLRGHLHQLRELVCRHLAVRLQKQFDACTDPDGEDSLFHGPDAELTCLNAVFVATQPK